MARRTKTVALLALLAALAAGGAVWSGRGWLAERWLLHRLRTGDVAARVEAIAELGRLGRAAAVPDILEAASRPGADPALHEAARSAFVAMGLPAAPRILEALGAEDARLRALAAEALPSTALH